MLYRLWYLSLLILLTGCGNLDREVVRTAVQQSNSELDINVWFSQTSGNYKKDQGIDTLLVKDILNAKEEIVVAIYAMTNDRIRDALITAQQHHVRVSVFTDDGAFFSDDIKRLKEAGITVRCDEDTTSLMHNKFMVIDHKIVWTGSCNYTYYAFYRNNENLVKIQKRAAADFYEKEFHELWDGKYVENAYISHPLEIYFSPEDDFEQRLLGLIAQAQKQILFLAFAFTNYDIAQALAERRRNGIVVQGIMDEKQHLYQKKYSQYTYLKAEGIDVRLDGNKFTLHDKVMIIDDTVITGSYNFTRKANDTNNENSIVVRKKSFTQRYREEFEKLYAQAKP